MTQFELTLNFDNINTTVKKGKIRPKKFFFNISIMMLTGCWSFMGTPTQNGVVTVGNNETTPLQPDPSRRVLEGEQETDK